MAVIDGTQTYNYSEIDGTVQRMFAFVQGLEAHVDDMTKRTQALVQNQQWTGDAAEGYSGRAARVNSGIDTGSVGIESLAKTTSSGGDAMAAADKKGAQIASGG